MCEDPYPDSKREFNPGEPPNRTRQPAIERLDPSPVILGGEEIFPDTGTSVEGFNKSSKQVAAWMKDV